MMPANNYVVRRGQIFKRSEIVAREQDANKYGTARGYPIEMSDGGMRLLPEGMTGRRTLCACELEV